MFRTTILGHNFSAPIFISPCARGAYGHPDGELNLIKGAAAGNVLYMVSRLPMTHETNLCLDTQF